MAINSISNLYDCLNEEIKLNTFIDFKPSNKSNSIPLIILHQTNVYAFYEVENENCEDELKNKLYELQKTLRLSICHFIFIGMLKTSEKTHWLQFDLRDNSLKNIPDTLSFLDKSFNERLISFTQSNMEEIYNKLLFLDNSNNKIKIDAEGNVFIKRGNKFFKASEQSSNKLFWITLLGGWLGIHKFVQGEKIQGFIYLLTIGLFGFGWLMDIISLLLGSIKDDYGLYLLPLDNTNIKALLLFVMIPVAVFMVFFYCKGMLTLLHLTLNWTNSISGLGG